MLPSPCQEDPSTIRAIDLEFATVYYAAHDLAYAMGGCCIKGAAARRTFVRAYIEELEGKAATDEEVRGRSLISEGSHPKEAIPFCRPCAADPVPVASRALHPRQVDSLAIDAMLFGLPMHIGPCVRWSRPSQLSWALYGSRVPLLLRACSCKRRLDLPVLPQALPLGVQP